MSFITKSKFTLHIINNSIIHIHRGPYNAIQEFPSKLGNIFIDVVPQDPYYHGWSSYGHYIELQAK